MRIDAHAHGMHAELGPEGKRVPPLVPGWKETDGPPEEHIKQHNDPGLLQARASWINIFHMRPGHMDRINRALPDLKILMAHFGNPWWEEAWTMLKSSDTIYADFSGGTAYQKSMNMWKELFAPNGEGFCYDLVYDRHHS